MVIQIGLSGRHPSGDNFYEISDPYNEFVVPYTTSNNGDTLYYTRVDGLGPENWTSGWYYGATPEIIVGFC